MAIMILDKCYMTFSWSEAKMTYLASRLVFHSINIDDCSSSKKMEREDRTYQTSPG